MPLRRLLPTLLSAALLAACATSPREMPASSSAASAPVAATPAVAAQPGTETGALAGAPYRIEIPANWNGELVLFAHGYEPVGTPRPDPWPRDDFTAAMLAKGYAVAASGYSAQGWAVAEAVADNERLRQHFLARHGTPARTWLVGLSMGGQVVLASGEQFPQAYAGVLSLCGVNTSTSELFTQGVVAPLAAFDALFPGTLPQAPLGLADPSLPPMLDGNAVEAALRGDEAKAQRLAERFDIPRDGLGGALWLQYLALRELATRSGGFPVDNRDYVYRGFGDDAALNRAVRRYAGDAKAMDYVNRHASLTGRIGVPVVLQSNNHDPTVPARFGNRYAQRMRDAGAGHLLTVLPPLGEGHCGFQPQQVDAAFDAMVAAAPAPMQEQRQGR